MKYCPRCGNKIRSTGLYCVYCGTDLQTRETPKKEDASKSSEITQQENVEYAKTFDRLIAIIIDSIFISIIVGIFTLLITGTFWWSFDMGYTLVWNSIYFPIAILYYVAMETYQGQTIGKRVMKLKTLDQNTLQTPTTPQHFLNNLTKALGVLFLFDIFVGYISNDGNPKHQIRYTQQLSKTVVVKLPQ